MNSSSTKSLSASTPIPAVMSGVLLVGHGGYDKLEFSDRIPVPKPGPGEVLIRVAAAAINNTDINTRIGWYSKSVRTGTANGGSAGLESSGNDDASWTGEAVVFPRIQGADCCGYIVRVGADVDPGRIGERVIVRNLLRTYVGYRP